MIERRYKANKYVRCYCEQRADVLVGVKLCGVLNPLAATVGGLIVVLAFFADVDPLTKIEAFCLLGLPWLIGFSASAYTARRHMQKAGHSTECSHKIGRLVALYGSLWTEFKIMEKEDNGKTSTLGKSKKRK